MEKHFFTIEVYNRCKWSDRYSCAYSTKEEAEERARQLYYEYELNDFYKDEEVVPHISNYYRIKETIETIITHELQ